MDEKIFIQIMDEKFSTWIKNDFFWVGSNECQTCALGSKN
jgi:hypothetical protein